MMETDTPIKKCKNDLAAHKSGEMRTTVEEVRSEIWRELFGPPAVESPRRVQVGDAADTNIEQGLDALLLHQTGECDTEGPCQYCAEEDRNAEKQIQKERKRSRKKTTQSAGALIDRIE